jgi:hypothetical protein
MESIFNPVLGDDGRDFVSMKVRTCFTTANSSAGSVSMSS